jgi:hypothetical protein
MKVAFRQIAGSFAQMEKARLVAKLKAARDREREANGKCEGRKNYAEGMPETVALATEPHAQGLSYRKISAEMAARALMLRDWHAALCVGGTEDAGGRVARLSLRPKNARRGPA